METITVSHLQQALQQTMLKARKHPVEIQADDGTVFVLELKTERANTTNNTVNTSPFDIAGIVPQSQVKLADVINAVHDSRER